MKTDKKTQSIVIGAIISLCFLLIGTLFWHKAPNSTDSISTRTQGHFNKSEQTDKLPSPSLKELATHVKTNISELGEPPRSLRGTEIDGDVRTDANGKLIIARDIRHLFDYFLAAAGEEPMETIINRIEQHIREMIPPEAADEAVAILDSYLLYKQGLYVLSDNHSSITETDDPTLTAATISEIGSILEQRKEMRRRYMREDVVDAFFGDEEMYEEFTLQHLSVKLNEDLTNEEKEIEIQQIVQQYPESITTYWQDDIKQKELNNAISQLRDQADSSEEIYELRKEAYGKEAADRFSALDEKRSQWQSRINEYIKSKQSIMDAQDLTQEEKHQAIENLGQESFSDRELMRVKVIEEMERKKQNS